MALPEAPEPELTDEQVRRVLPELPKAAVLAGIGERIYQRDGKAWYLLDN